MSDDFEVPETYSLGQHRDKIIGGLSFAPYSGLEYLSF